MTRVSACCTKRGRRGIYLAFKGPVGHLHWRSFNFRVFKQGLYLVMLHSPSLPVAGITSLDVLNNKSLSAMHEIRISS